ncbi:MAG: hypothetical protein PUA52_08815 [Lachnospiraceae bacterium]|nr:hypothetical protein [Lachnospiraceae bacterium]
MIKAIVYTSQTGYTAAYAALLADKTGVKAVSLEEAVSAVPEQSEILYLGWLMAGKVQGYDKARKIYRVSALCGVGMGRTGTQLDDIRRQNGVPEAMPVFSLQGGFDRTRLRGLYRFMMTVMAKTAGRSLANKVGRTPEEDDMLDLMTNGGSRVSEDNLTAVLAWFEACHKEENDV